MKKEIYNDILDYIIVTIIIVISGAVIYQNYNQEFLLLSYTFFITIFLFRNKKITFNKKNLTIIFLIVILLLINYLFNIDSGGFSKYISYILRFTMPFILIKIISFENFKNKYCNIVYWLSICSLILYFMLIINPSFVNSLPKIKDFSGRIFGNAGLYVYMIPIQNSYRNNSIFWEAGAFQVIVNLALFFNLFISNIKSKKKTIIYSITIISTTSTIGYILLVLNVGIYILKNKKNKIIKYYIFIAFILIVITSSFGDVIFDKFHDNNISYNRRTADIIVDINIATDKIENTLVGVGIVPYLKEFPKELSNIYGLEGSSSSNGISSTLAQFGMIFTIVLIYYYLSNLRYIFKKNLYVFIIIVVVIMVFSTENFMFSPLFLLLASYKNSFVKNN